MSKVIKGKNKFNNKTIILISNKHNLNQHRNNLSIKNNNINNIVIIKLNKIMRHNHSLLVNLLIEIW
jgi:hypothetical protein